MILRKTCPICDSDQVVKVFSRSYSSDELGVFLANLPTSVRETYKVCNFEIRHCPACDFAFQSHVPDDKEVAAIYRFHEDPREIDQQIADHKLHWFAHVAEEVIVMRQMVANPRPQVLDFGPNWGKWASMALAFGCRVDAVEVNPITSRFCQDRGINIISLDEINQNYYDFINVDQVLEHLSEPLILAKRLAGALRPSGYMKWSTPRNSTLVHDLAASSARQDEVLRPENIDALYPLLHVNLFSNRSLQLLGAHSGLDCVSLPFFKSLGAGQIWNMPRQFGRNLTLPWKRWRRNGTCLWFRHCVPE